MSGFSLFGAVQVSGTLVVDAQGRLTVLPEGLDPRPGDVVIDILEDAEVGEDVNVVVVQDDGSARTLEITALDADAIIAQIESGQDPTDVEGQETAAGEENGSSPTTTGVIERDGTQVIASTQFDTTGLEAQGLTATQSLTLLQFSLPAPIEPVGPVSVVLNGPDNVIEGSVNNEFTVALGESAPVGSIVNLVYEYISASGEDIVEVAEAIVSEDGVTAAFNLQTIDDNLAEGTETFVIRVSSVVNSEGEPVFDELDLTEASHQVTITDEDDPGEEDTVVVTLEGPSDIAEGDVSNKYTVTLSSPAPVGTVVNLTYTYTTASNEDIVETTQAVIGEDGQTATFTIQTVDDNLAEGSEAFTVSVASVVDGDDNPIFEALDLTNASLETTITDEEDPGPEDTVAVTLTGPSNIVEGEESAAYTATLSSPAPVGTIVNLTYTYTTASNEDIVETTQAVIGEDGETATFTIQTVDDNLAEGSEAFTVSVESVVDGDDNPIFEALDLTNASLDTTITDEEDPGPEDTVAVTLTGPSTIVEGEESATYTATISSPAPVGTIVNLTYTYTTASNEDIVETTQAVIGEDGQTATFTIQTVDDNLAEGSEAFTVSVESVVDGDDNPIFEVLDLTNASLDTTITDEEDPGPEDTVAVTLTGPSTIVEGEESATYTATISSPAPVGTIVNLTYTYTTASNEDIVETTQAVIGEDGQTATFTIQTVDDNLAEGSEAFTVSVESVVDGDDNPIFEALDLTNASLDTTITDEEDPGPEDTVAVTLTGPSTIVEGEESATYTATISSPAPVGTIVNLTYTYTTASNEDIVETTQAVIGEDGQTATFTIQTVDDNLAEGSEAFTVSVESVVDGDDNPIFEELDLTNASQETSITDETDPDDRDAAVVTLTGPSTIVEGEESTDYTVSLSTPAPVGTIVNLTYTYTTASNEDIVETTQAVIGEDGQTATFTIQTVDDNLAEGSEAFTVSVESVVDGDDNPIFEALDLTNASQETSITDETDPDDRDAAVVTLTGPSSIVEGEESTDYTVSLSTPAPVGTIVNLTYTYTTASNEDIVETTQAVIGEDGETATFTIQTVDDNLAEGSEAFTVSVASVVDGDNNPIFEELDLTNASQETSITDETDPDDRDAAVVTLTGPSTIVEGEESATYTATISSPAPVGTIVNLTYTYTTASNEDIVETTQAVIGEDGQTATFTIQTVDDNLAEGSEAFTVSVESVVDGDDNPIFEELDLTNASQETSITDETDPDDRDAAVVTLTGPSTIVEGEESTDYTVSLSTPAPVGTIVNLTYTYTTASNEDIVETTQAVIGEDGQTATFTIQTVDDNLAEGSEAFTVSVESVVDGDDNPIFEALDLTNASQETSITDETDPDDRDAAVVTLTGPSSIVEGEESTDYTVSLSTPAPVGTIVNLTYTYTTASNEDIVETTQAVIGEDGETATFTIQTVDDNLAEGSEAFTVSVASVVDGDNNPIFEELDLTNASQETSITDETDPDDRDAAVVTLTGPSTIVEGEESATYTATLSSPAPVGTIVNLTYTYTTASNEDIVETTQAVIGEDGETATFTIQTVDDNLAEGSEAFTVSVESVVDGDDNPIFEALDLTNASQETSITDETDPDDRDAAVVTLTGPSTIVEGEESATYTATLSSPAPVGTIVNLTYTYTTASNEDIVETTQAVIGEDGETATFTIQTVDDNLAEGSEAFTVSVESVVDGDDNPIFEALDLTNASQETSITDETDPDDRDAAVVTLTGPSTIVEGEESATYTATLSSPAPVGTIVNLTYTYTTASNEDIVETTQAVIGEDGETATFTIQTVDDNLAEGSEAFTVSVESVVDGDDNPIFEALDLTNASQETSITDETDPDDRDAAVVTLTGPSTIVEGEESATYTATLSSPAPVGTIVNLTYTYTTASNEDIVETTQAVIGEDGETATFTIQTVDDNLAEGSEAFTVSVESVVDGDDNPIFEELDLTNASQETSITDETDPDDRDAAVVTLTGPSTIVEGEESATYTATLSSPAPVGTIVNLTYTYTTASNEDIVETTQAVIGEDGETATFTIQTVDDNLAEGSEAFTVSVESVVDGDDNPIFEELDLTNASQETSITDETDPDDRDAAVVTLTGPSTIVEGEESATYTATLSSPAPVGTIVNLTYTYTTASNEDIVETTQAVIGEDGETATFTIQTVDDNLAEGSEAFTVSVESVVDGDDNPIFEELDLTNASQETSITDETDPDDRDAAVVTLTGPSTIVEGEESATYTATLSSPAPVGTIVNLTYTYTTASNEDIVETTQAVIGEDGETATFTIQTVDDNLAEGSEAFTVSVESVVDGDNNPIFEALDLTNASQETSITDETDPDDRDAAVVTLTGPSSIVEGEESTDYTVSLSTPAPVGTIVNLTYTYTTASNEDIVETTQAVIGEDGETATFTIQTVDDNLAEGSEAFTVSVESVVDGDDNPIFEELDLTNASQETSITDETDPDDRDAAVVTLTGPSTIVEGEESATYTATLSSPAPVGTIVNLTYTYTTASNEDIVETTQAVIGEDGETATFTIQTVDDNLAEGSEAFTVSVASVVDGDNNPIFEELDLTNASQETSITDETDPDDRDAAVVTLTGPSTIVEGEESATYTATLSSPAPVGTIVNLTYTYTTASNEDIVETTQAVIGEDGETATFTIQTVDDNLAEGSEAFTVSVESVVDGDDNPIFEELDLTNASQETSITDETDPDDRDAAVVTLTGPSSVNEGDFTGVYTALLDSAVPEGSIIKFTYTYTTASNLDIVETSQATVGDDGLTATFTIQTLQDGVIEGDEVFSVSVSAVETPEGQPIFEALDLSQATQDTTIVELNNPPEVTDFELYASDDNIPLDFSDFITDLEDDQDPDKVTMIKIEEEPAFGQLYFITDVNGDPVRFDLEAGDMIAETHDIYYDVDVAFDATIDGFTGDLAELEEQGIILTGGTYAGDAPHDNLTQESIGFDGAGVLKQRGYFTQRAAESGSGKETESATKEYMSVKFQSGLVNTLAIGIGAMTGSFNNGDSKVFVYLYADGVLLDPDPIVVNGPDSSSSKQALINVDSDVAFDEFRIIPVDDSGQNAGFVLQSIEIIEAQIEDQFVYSAVDADGLASTDTATVDVNILSKGNLDLTDELDYAVQGGSGVTVIHGTDGNDLLIGGAGDDVMTGGEGNDIFKWAESDLDGGYDIIKDFSQEVGNDDVIDLSDLFDDDDTLADLLAADVIQSEELNGNTVISIDKGNDKTVSIELEGVVGVDLSTILIINEP
ncbi:hypothetical protein J4N45_27140 [Vibrio sp. SCSIO 43140]|uniref:Calx-beta domain-containing protein n=1 Tax=Vibrio sp. SCSIO 43140 TaxID=2819100 RepID=UPI00207607A5|nr:Calx-beta domain-containing protein [Vibrio sp. SCSIO 43140]USD63022.1 hypothetical protein J4N45_27140 [Vibrio sp. SCSIO 43140]